MIKYIVPFLISFILSIFLILIAIYFGKKIKWHERETERHIHRKGTLRIGGIVMVVAFNLTILLVPDLLITPSLLGFMVASLMLLIIGIWDDVKEIFWEAQLFYQVSLAILIFIMGVRIYYITNPLTGGIINLSSGISVVLSVFLVIIWITLMINSMNWLDGIDGLSGGVTFIGALTIFFLSLKPEVNQPPMAILAMILAGTTLAFLIFNFNPSRILAGTSGAMFMGFALATMAIFAGTKIVTAILIMAVPIIDFLWVLGERIKNKKSIFRPDKNHLHYKLLDLGWSQKKIAFYFYVVTIVIAIIALNTRFIGKSITILVTFIFIISALIFISKKINNNQPNEQ